VRSERGLTLVEVMVSTVLASLVVAGGFMILASQRPIITGQMKIAKRQQDLWVAMEFIQRDFRKAGMGFGYCNATQGGVVYKAHANVWPNGSANTQVLRPIVITDGGTNGSDALQLMWFEPLNVGAGNAKLSGTWKTDGSTPTMTVQPQSTATGPDGAQGFMTGVGGPCAAATWGGVNLLGLISTIDAAANPKDCWVFGVTGATCNAGGGTLTTQYQPTIAGAVAPPYAPLGVQTYSGGSYFVSNLGVQRRVTYSINTATIPPQLERSADGAAPDVVAFGIEDLQLSPGCDVNANGFIDPEPITDAARTTDEWFNNVAGDTVSATCTAYPQVRVTLVSRTLEPDGAFTLGVRPKIENRAGAVLNDQYHRRVLSQVVSAQNVNL